MMETIEISDGISIEYETNKRYKIGNEENIESLSEYIIDSNNNLWVKGNNQYGKLGINESNEYIDNWIRIDNPDINNKISSIKIDNNDKKDFVVFITTDNKYYYAGKFGAENIIKWTEENEFIKNKIFPFKISDNNNIQRFENSFIVKDKLYHPLFKFKKINKSYFVEATFITNSDLIKVLMSGNEINHEIYTEFAVTPKNQIQLALCEEDEYIVCYILIDCLGPMTSFNSITFDVRNIQTGEFIALENYDDIVFNNENVISSIIYERSNIGFFGSLNNEEMYNIKVPVNLNEFYMIKLNVDIGNTKIYINGEENDIFDNKLIIPFEDQKYKGPQFLYPIFYNLGIPFNEYIRFEGIITVNGVRYMTTHVLISEPIDETNNYGVIQFLLSKENKIDLDILLENKNKEYGITFYPIKLINDKYVYFNVSNISDTVINQGVEDLNPGIVQSLDGFIYFDNKLVRSGFPKSFEI